MKRLFEEPPSPDVHSNDASTSGQSRDDQEMGSHSLSKQRDDLLENSTFLCFPHGMDLNPARMVLAEMVGTFILMFCVCGILASTELLRGKVGLLEYAATAGLTIVVIIFSIGPISGAHVNPAITIAFATFDQFPWSKVPLYILAQTVGSILATFVGKCVYGMKADLMTTRPLQGWTAAFWVELIGTFMIVFLAASLNREAQSVGRLSGLVIGIAIGLAVLITGPVSGGSLNPARSVGPAVVSWNFEDLWIYISAPTLGAVAGGLLFRILRLRCKPCGSNASPNTNLLNHSLVFGESLVQKKNAFGAGCLPL